MIPHTLCLMPTRRNKPPHRCPACIVRRTDSPKNLFLKHCKLQLVQQRKTIDGPYLLRRVFRGFALLCQEIESPDISGSITISDAYFSQSLGAFKFVKQVNSWCGAQAEVTHYYTVSFDSNRINSLYSGNKLQPKAYQILMIIKI